MSTIAQAVSRGIAFLDEKRPGWHNEIDVDSLDIGSSYGCLLAQLYRTAWRNAERRGSPFCFAAKELALRDAVWRENLTLDEHDVCAHAFGACPRHCAIYTDVPDTIFSTTQRVSYAFKRLNALWRNEIYTRRAEEILSTLDTPTAARELVPA